MLLYCTVKSGCNISKILNMYSNFLDINRSLLGTTEWKWELLVFSWPFLVLMALNLQFHVIPQRQKCFPRHYPIFARPPYG